MNDKSKIVITLHVPKVLSTWKILGQDIEATVKFVLYIQI